jgi:hypothetical protein
MTEKREYHSKRQIIDVGDFLDRSQDYYIVCLNASMIYALRVMAKTRLLWPSSYAVDRYEQYYTLPDDTQFDLIDEVVSEFLADTDNIEMCNQLLIDTLSALGDTIRLSSCCFEAGRGAQTINGDIYYGEAPPESEPTAFGPGEEFETEEKYVYKHTVGNDLS